jgi:hypothetical protein
MRLDLNKITQQMYICKLFGVDSSYFSEKNFYKKIPEEKILFTTINFLRKIAECGAIALKCSLMVYNQKERYETKRFDGMTLAGSNLLAAIYSKKELREVENPVFANSDFFKSQKIPEGVYGVLIKDITQKPIFG